MIRATSRLNHYTRTSQFTPRGCLVVGCATACPRRVRHYETPRWCPPLPPTGADGKPAHMARAQRALTTGHTRPLAQSQWQRFGLGQSLSQWHRTASGPVCQRWAAATRRTRRGGLGQSLSQWHRTASGPVWAAATRRTLFFWKAYLPIENTLNGKRPRIGP